ncbi:MAG TPA: DNA-formamidopyrimidine glycosylase family protein, partial [Pyrinomonadaceae bacterium]|nr:DNA-formamidopyrimidine glycosylase family protein [Pyrinomonadaceae bacterium]
RNPGAVDLAHDQRPQHRLADSFATLVPELPDITVYIEALEQRIQGTTLERVRVASPFLLRTAVPPLSSVEGREVTDLRRLGKRICIGVEGDLWLVLHLMIAGRLHWYDERAKAAKGRSVAVFEFSTGSLTLTEAGTQKRASLHVVQGEAGLDNLNPGGLEIFDATTEEFARALRARNHTLKRALTDPRILSGIGNAYSDEILFEAKLSPFTLTQKLTDKDIEQLFATIKRTLTDWVERLRSEAKDRFPEKVTAFRPDMATHGKYGEPCPRCGSKIQRIRYGSNETNYCPTCQTGGKLLADRALSRLLKDDWPRTPEELENLGRR